MPVIELTKGKVATVCDCHYNFIAKFKWCYSPTGYAVRRVGGRKANLTYMHRVISEAGLEDITDHIDGDRLNNSCENLRACDRRLNNVNKGITIANSSGYKGVSWIKRRNSWQSRLQSNGTTIFGRYFNTAEEAALAYDIASIQVNGDFSKLNIIGAQHGNS